MKKSYPFKHWLASILLGPILWTGFGVVYYGASADHALELISLSYQYGFPFSLPVLAIYLPLCWLLSKLKIHVVLIKLLLSAFVIAGTYITLTYFPGGHFVQDLFPFYAIAILVSGLIFDFKKKTVAEVEEAE